MKLFQEQTLNGESLMCCDLTEEGTHNLKPCMENLDISTNLNVN